jgi:antitoxin (DNA-binding transcriptional repressor) of toxin-antitoxin stability system
MEKAGKGEEIIARGAKPVARLVPLKKQPGDRKPGAWKGKITSAEDAFAPLRDKGLDDLGFESGCEPNAKWRKAAPPLRPSGWMHTL